MKAKITLLAVFVLAVLSHAQYVQRPEETEPIQQQETTTVETGSPQTTDLEPTGQSYQQPINAGQQSGVDEEERLRQEKALLEKDRKYFESVLGNQKVPGAHGWAKKELANVKKRLGSLENQINDLAHEMRRGQNKHRQELDTLNQKVDGIWESEEAKKFKESLKEEILNKLSRDEQPEEEAQGVANNGSWSTLWYWVGILAIVLFIAWLARRTKRQGP